MIKKLTRIMSVWCDKPNNFCEACDPNCIHAYIEYDYEDTKEVKE